MNDITGNREKFVEGRTNWEYCRMSIKIIQGDLLDAFDRGEVHVIGHVVNCQGVMGSGIAKSIRERYPLVYEEYSKLYMEYKSNPLDILGVCQGVWLNDNKGIFNLHSQLNFGYGKRQLNYGAFAAALGLMLDGLVVGDIVGFPYKIGCDRAGGDWEIVSEMIEYYFRDNEVKIYQLKD